MGYYLYDNPPRSSQYRSPRRDPVSGVVVWHNSGGSRTAAANLAKFIATRSDPGSYHELGNSGSDWIVMLPDDVECFGNTTGENRHAYQLCLTGGDLDFVPGQAATVAGLDQITARTVAFWKRRGITPFLDRFLTYSEAHDQRRPGVIHHGTLQPADRSDAWSRSPHRAALDAYALDRLRSLMGATPPPPKPKDTNVARTAFLRNKDGRQEEFYVRMSDGTLRQRWQDTSGKWGGWVDFAPKLPGAVEEVAGFVNNDGRLEIVCRNHTFGWSGRAWQRSAGGSWDGWGPA